MSIEQFCLKQGVPVNEFNKWYRDTHKRIHPIHVDGIPSEEVKEPSVEAPIHLCCMAHARAKFKYAYEQDGTVERKRSSLSGLLPTGRKNSLFFGNHAMAEISALYHTFIAARPLVACKARTCQMMGLSILKYFKKLFSAIAAGRTDYENMLPMTIGLCKAA